MKLYGNKDQDQAFLYLPWNFQINIFDSYWELACTKRVVKSQKMDSYSELEVNFPKISIGFKLQIYTNHPWKNLGNLVENLFDPNPFSGEGKQTYFYFWLNLEEKLCFLTIKTYEHLTHKILTFVQLLWMHCTSLSLRFVTYQYIYLLTCCIGRRGRFRRLGESHWGE